MQKFEILNWDKFEDFKCLSFIKYIIAILGLFYNAFWVIKKFFMRFINNVIGFYFLFKKLFLEFS